jgi:hypothetical protein
MLSFMADAKTTAGTRLTLRLDEATLARLDAVAALYSRPGLTLAQTDAMRMALMRGLDSIEEEQKKIRKPKA